MCFEVNDEEEADKVKEKEEKEKDKDKDKVKQTEEEEEKEKEEAPNTDPYLKYANHDLGVLEEGVSFRIRGKIPNQASVFSIHFLPENEKEDCALRILVLVEENLIARYYKENNNWGPEENYSQSPYTLAAGKLISIEVLITERGFYIALNGFHLCIFKHHFPYASIKSLEIRGDFDLMIVERKFVVKYPQRPAKSNHFGHIAASGKLQSNEKQEDKAKPKSREDEGKKKDEQEEEEEQEDLFDETAYFEIIDAPPPKMVCVRKTYLPVPYFVCFERGLFDIGFSFVIVGRIRPQALHFNVSFLTGSHRWPAPGVCYDVVFKLYNSKKGEKAPALDENDEAIDVKLGDDLTLIVTRGKKGYETKVNKKSLKTRPYRINPLAVNTSLIYGDLKLIDIQMVTD